MTTDPNTTPNTTPSNVLYNVTEHIATITLNRPDRLNAYTAAMGAELRQAMHRATDDADVRVIILTGAGRGFCAGADMDTLGGIQGQASGGGDLSQAATGDGPWDASASPDYQMAHSYFPAVPKPIIAAINGACAGLGWAWSTPCFVMCALRRPAPSSPRRFRAADWLPSTASASPCRAWSACPGHLIC